MTNEVTSNNSSDASKNNTTTPPPQKDDDIYKTGLLMGMLVLTYFINHSFGFEMGTLNNGLVVSLGIIVWLVIAIVDYFTE